MTKAEVAKLLAVIAEAYSQKFDVTDSKVETWHTLLADLEWETAKEATKRHILISQWPPTIAEIREAAVAMSTPPRLSALEAWGRVLEAIRQYGWPREEEALASVGPEVAAVARQFGWMDLCMAENASVIRGQFCKLWDQQEARESEMQQLPEAMRARVAALADKMALPRGGREC